MRQKLHEGFVELGADPRQLHIVVSYGATEFRGGSQECLTGPGDFSSSWYHTCPDMELYEIIDPDTGKPVPEGPTGEVVYTCLDGRGTVLIRYRTGDLAVGGLTNQPCPYCGSTVPRISNELRRVSNMQDLQLTKLKGSLIDTGAFVPLLRGIDSVEEFQVELCKRNDDPFDVDELVIHVAAKAGASTNAVADDIKSTLQVATEVAPNRVEFHSLAELLQMVGMETSLKDVRLVDKRPQKSRI
jgi:phenylacetate-coenzyme A ligase PaaK-like adenylate-forming protein